MRPREPPNEINKESSKGGVDMMTREKKKEVVAGMAEEFMNTESVEEKSFAFMLMTVYMEGKAAGKQEERQKWEKQQKAST